jgi:hypothetical protein
VAERVVPLELGVEWEPNAPDALLLVSDSGLGLLVLRAHFADVDQRFVTLLWGGCVAAMMQPPNDEALSGHSLYEQGLSEVLWAGEVLDSSWLADLERRNRVHPRHDPGWFADLRHFILPVKEKTVEVVANGWKVVRSERMLDPWYDIDAYGRVDPAKNASEIIDSWRARAEKPGSSASLTETEKPTPAGSKRAA